MASQTRQNKKSLLGKKVGMTRVFSEDGKHVPVTVIQAGPCTVLQVRTAEKDGYTAVQLAFDDVRKRRKKPQQAVYDKLGCAQKRLVREVPHVDPSDIQTDGEDGGEVAPGSTVNVSVFEGVARVDVGGVSKGRGFSGGVRRHGFSTGDESHGGKSVRLRGSTGMHTDPGRVLKGTKMPGQYGNKKCKVRNLDVVSIDPEENLLVVKGAVPGPNGGYLYIEESLS